VVATRAGGIPLQVRPDVDGKLVEPGDRQAIADAIFELFTERRRDAVVATNVDMLAVEKPRGGRWRDDDGLKLPSEEFLTIGNSVGIVESARDRPRSPVLTFSPYLRWF
jgi:hypothetical protein